MENILILTVGYPRSGKSTWSRAYSEKYGVPVVNPDSIRLSLHGQDFLKQQEPLVWYVAKVMVESLFRAGHKKVILDATSLTMMSREQWRSDKWMVRFKPVTTDKEVCKERALKDGREYLVDVIEKMSMFNEPLDEEEQKGILEE